MSTTPNQSQTEQAQIMLQNRDKSRPIIVLWNPITNERTADFPTLETFNSNKTLQNVPNQQAGITPGKLASLSKSNEPDMHNDSAKQTEIRDEIHKTNYPALRKVLIPPAKTKTLNCSTQRPHTTEFAQKSGTYALKKLLIKKNTEKKSEPIINNGPSPGVPVLVQKSKVIPELRQILSKRIQASSGVNSKSISIVNPTVVNPLSHVPAAYLHTPCNTIMVSDNSVVNQSPSILPKYSSNQIGRDSNKIIHAKPGRLSKQTTATDNLQQVKSQTTTSVNNVLLQSSTSSENKVIQNSQFLGKLSYSDHPQSLVKIPLVQNLQNASKQSARIDHILQNSSTEILRGDSFSACSTMKIILDQAVSEQNSQTVPGQFTGTCQPQQSPHKILDTREQQKLGSTKLIPEPSIVNDKSHKVSGKYVALMSPEKKTMTLGHLKDGVVYVQSPQVVPGQSTGTDQPNQFSGKKHTMYNPKILPKNLSVLDQLKGSSALQKLIQKPQIIPGISTSSDRTNAFEKYVIISGKLQPVIEKTPKILTNHDLSKQKSDETVLIPNPQIIPGISSNTAHSPLLDKGILIQKPKILPGKSLLTKQVSDQTMVIQNSFTLKNNTSKSPAISLIEKTPEHLGSFSPSSSTDSYTSDIEVEYQNAEDSPRSGKSEEERILVQKPKILPGESNVTNQVSDQTAVIQNPPLILKNNTSKSPAESLIEKTLEHLESLEHLKSFSPFSSTNTSDSEEDYQNTEDSLRSGKSEKERIPIYCEKRHKDDHNYSKFHLDETSDDTWQKNQEEIDLITEGIAQNESEMKYSTTLKTSSEGERIMVLTPFADISNSKTFSNTVKESTINSQNSDKYHQSLGGSENMSASCEWRIESVYSLAPNIEMEDQEEVLDVETDWVESLDDHNRNHELSKILTFSLNDCAWKKHIKPSFVVLERSEVSRQGERNTEVAATTKCSEHCRLRTLKLLCELNLLKCKYRDNEVKHVEERAEILQSDNDVEHTSNILESVQPDNEMEQESEKVKIIQRDSETRIVPVGLESIQTGNGAQNVNDSLELAQKDKEARRVSERMESFQGDKVEHVDKRVEIPQTDNRAEHDITRVEPIQHDKEVEHNNVRMESLQTNVLPVNMYDIIKQSRMRRKPKALLKSSDKQSSVCKTKLTSLKSSAKMEAEETDLFKKALYELKYQVARKRTEKLLKKKLRKKMLDSVPTVKRILENSEELVKNITLNKQDNTVLTGLKKKKQKGKKTRRDSLLPSSRDNSSPVVTKQFATDKKSSTDLSCDQTFSDCLDVNPLARNKSVSNSQTQPKGFHLSNDLPSMSTNNLNTVIPDNQSGLSLTKMPTVDENIVSNSTKKPDLIQMKPKSIQQSSATSTEKPDFVKQDSAIPTPNPSSIKQNMASTSPHASASIGNLIPLEGKEYPVISSPSKIVSPTTIHSPTSSEPKSLWNNMPHKAFSVKKSGSTSYLVPTSNSNPISPSKFESALNMLSKHLQKTSENIMDQGGTKFFLVKVGDQHVIVKTGFSQNKNVTNSNLDKCKSAAGEREPSFSGAVLTPCVSFNLDKEAQFSSHPPKQTTGTNNMQNSIKNIALDVLKNAETENLKNKQIVQPVPIAPSLTNPSFDQPITHISATSSTPSCTTTITTPSSAFSSCLSSTTSGSKRPLSPPDVRELMMKRKRQKLEAKYPLPAGVIIKSEPITQGYELDSNWSVTSEIDMGYAQEGVIDQGAQSLEQPEPLAMEEENQNTGRACLEDNLPPITNSQMNENDELPPLLERVSTLSPNKEQRDNSFDHNKAPPVLQQMSSISPLQSSLSSSSPLSPPPLQPSPLSYVISQVSNVTTPISLPPPIHQSPIRRLLLSPPKLFSRPTVSKSSQPQFPSPPSLSSPFQEVNTPLFTPHSTKGKNFPPSKTPSFTSTASSRPAQHSSSPLLSDHILTTTTNFTAKPSTKKKSQPHSSKKQKQQQQTDSKTDYESGYDSRAPSESSSSETLTSAPSVIIPDTANHQQGNGSFVTSKSKIQQLKELLKKKEMQVNSLLKIQSQLHVDLDSV